MWSVGRIPGTASCFWRNSGTQKEWITSFAVNGRTADRLLPYCGYVNVQANCWAVTFTRKGFEPAASSLARTIALTIAIAVTSSAGRAVQAISSPVCPWIGGPSESSSGFARNFHTAITLTAATIEKMKMQIPVTNQKTKSIRPASRDADWGSQSGISATADAIAPASTPITISWTIEPLRTDAPSLLHAGVRVRRFPPRASGEPDSHIQGG